MASKSIQILVNEFPAATGSSVVVGRVSWQEVGIILEICKRRLDDFAIAASTLRRFNASTSVPSGLLLDLMQ
jgi:hypothetical protein